MIYSLVCTDVNEYVNWQCELLEFSWRQVRQPGELIRLVTCPQDAVLPRHERARVVRVGTPGERTRGYLAFERLFALQDWLRMERPRGTLLILDPDCVFRRRVEAEVEIGSPVAQFWVDFPAQPPTQAATWPMLINSDDLERLLPAWIDLTAALWSATGRWESDMFAMASAAAKIGLRFTLGAVGAYVGWPDEVVGAAPIVHYCQRVYATDGSLLWDKRKYQPWAQVPDGESARHSYCRDLLALVNQCAAQRRPESSRN